MATNHALTVAECNTYHNPSGASGMNPTNIGVCSDNDLDEVQDLIDNCPSDANIDQLDTGFWGEVGFTNEIIPLIALEGSVGYFTADGTSSELWGIPVFLNAKVQIPIAVVEGYAGLGIGGVYADWETGGASDSDFVGAWDAFLGLQVGLGDFGVGAEAKYLQTEDTKDNFAIEGTSVAEFLSRARLVG